MGLAVGTRCLATGRSQMPLTPNADSFCYTAVLLSTILLRGGLRVA